MIGGISFLALINLIAVFFIVITAHLVCIFVVENGGYKQFRFRVITIIAGVLWLTALISVGIYSRMTTDITDKIDGIAITTRDFPDKIEDCADSSAIRNLFDHYGIQHTAELAGDALKTYEATIATLLLVFTLIPTILFGLSWTVTFTEEKRYRLFWYGYSWVVWLEVMCFIICIFHDIVEDAQGIMKGAGGVVGQALDNCTDVWDSILPFMFDTDPKCTSDVKAEINIVCHKLKDFGHADLAPFTASTASTAFLLPLLTLTLGLGVYFTWEQTSRRKGDIKLSSSTDW
jgi:hypothetical protein